MSRHLRRGIISSAVGETNDTLLDTFFFDGSDEYITIPNVAALDPTTGLSINVWISSQDASIFKTIITKFSFSDGNNRAIELRQSGSKFVFLLSDDGSTTDSVTSTTTIADDTFYMVTCVYDGTDMLLYVNGVEEDSLTFAGPIHDTVTQWVIGSYGGTDLGGSSDFNGRMANFSLSIDQFLSPTDITNLYQSGIRSPYFETIPGAITGDMDLAYELSSRDDTIEDLIGSNDGTGNDVAANGAQLTFGDYNGAVDAFNTLLLDGAGQFVTFPDFDSNNISFGGWINVDSTGPNNENTLLSKWLSAGDWGSFYDKSTDNFTAWISTNGTNTSVVTDTVDLTDAWNFYMVTYDGTTVRLYINAVEVDISVTLSGNINNGSNPVYFGRRSNAGGDTQDYAGSVGPLYVFDVAISPLDVTTLYNNGLGKQPENFSSGITDNYNMAVPLNDGVIDPENDRSSGGANDATLFGSPTYTGELLPFGEGVITTQVNTLLLDGSTDYYVIDDSDDFNLGTAAAFACRVYPTDLSSTNTIYHQRVDSDNEINFSIETTGKLRFSATFGASLSFDLQSTDNLVINQWTMIGFVIDGTTAKVFFNDSFDVTTDTVDVSPTNLAADIELFRDATGTNYYTGSSSSIKYIGAALQATDLEELYNSGSPKLHALYSSTINGANCKLAMESGFDLPSTTYSDDVEASTEYINDLIFDNKAADYNDSTGDWGTFSQGTPANRPTAAAADLNNKDAVEFDSASSQFVEDTTTYNLNNFDIFVMQRTTGSGVRCMFANQDPGGDNGDEAPIIASWSGNSLRTRWGNGAAAFETFDSTIGMTDNNFVVNSWTDALDAEQTINGTPSPAESSVSFGPVNSASNDAWIGCLKNTFSPSGTNFYDGFIHRMILFDARVSEATRSSIIKLFVSQYLPNNDLSDSFQFVTENGSPTLTGQSLTWEI